MPASRQHYNEGRDLHLKRERGFFDKSVGVSVFIACLFALSLFTFVHFREVRVEFLELGTEASRYVVAQTDFSFRDDEATTILQQEAVRDIGKIYRISEERLRQARMQLENDLTSSQQWREQVDKTTFEGMHRALDQFEKVLLSLRLTDPRTLRKMREAQVDTTGYYIFSPGDPSREIILPQSIWSSVAREAFADDPVDPSASEYLKRFFQKQNWLLGEDVESYRALRHKVQTFVPDKYTQVKAGQRIIDQGDKVTPRHLAMLQAMKNALTEQRNLWHPATMSGSLLLTLLLMAISVAYLRGHYPEVVSSNRSLFLLVTVVLLTLVLAKIFEYIVLTASKDLYDVVRYPLFAPFAAILLCALMNPAIAAYAAGFVAIVLSFTLATERHGFLLTNIAAAVVAIVSTRSLRRRKEIFVVCAQAWLACAVVIVAFLLYQDKLWHTSTLVDLASSAAFMMLTGVLVVGVLPVLESLFDVMTDVSLMEYMDPNHELLRRLAIEAPGTYQHSVIVGNLSEAAACSINANGLFCRVSTLYHDIGKLTTPQYFTENQQGGMNIHQLLTPLESAQVIMAHVTEGVVMARRAGLPEPFVDIIKEHHGTTLVYYFYRKAVEQAEGGEDSVDEYDFRYKGPKPRSKESTIIMIADSLEAASRSLDEITEATLTDLVESLVRQKIEDGQFDRCVLTFEELQTAKRAMVKTLLAAGHSRVKYPESDAAEK